MSVKSIKRTFVRKRIEHNFQQLVSNLNLAFSNLATRIEAIEKRLESVTPKADNEVKPETPKNDSAD